MKSELKSLAAIAVCVVCPQVQAVTPYNVVVLERETRTIIEVDLDTGQQTTVPIALFDESDLALALASNNLGEVFVINDLFSSPGVAKWESRFDRWSTVVGQHEIDFPLDLEVTSQGFIVAGELSLDWLAAEFEQNSLRLRRPNDQDIIYDQSRVEYSAGIRLSSTDCNFDANRSPKQPVQRFSYSRPSTARPDESTWTYSCPTMRLKHKVP